MKSLKEYKFVEKEMTYLKSGKTGQVYWDIPKELMDGVSNDCLKMLYKKTNVDPNDLGLDDETNDFLCGKVPASLPDYFNEDDEE
ncbi:MAG: hypothetical protein KBD53_04890 [Candidatus Omnitrophica bacterium]|nr:hypothetical protein [Candidatus Omnitrophota bacterium]